MFRIQLAKRCLVPLAFAAFVSTTTPAQQHPALTPNSEYDQTIFFTPGGLPDYVGPMVPKMIGGGDAAWVGGGRYAKVGIPINLEYTSMTEGLDDDYQYYVNRGPERRALPLPPDVLSLSELPPIVRDGLLSNTNADDLASWATLSKMPPVIAGLEWARYLDLPYTLQIFTGLSDGGSTDRYWSEFNLDNYFEGLGSDHGKGHCALDASGLCQPSDLPDAPQGTDSWAGNSISFATPSMADPAYASYQLRNLRAAIVQVLAIASDARYAGRLIALGFEPEINIPSHQLDDSNWLLPTPWGGGAPIKRHFVCDYSAPMIARFQGWLQTRYGDATPMDDTNGDGRTFWGDFGPDPAVFPDEYVNQGWAAVMNSTWAPRADHLTVPTTWQLVDAPRKFPKDHKAPVTPFWHMWTDFRVEQVAQRLDEMTSTMMLAGMPGERIFTHQMPPGESLQPWRAEGPLPNDPHWSENISVIDYCNDFSALNPSGAFGGVNLYGVGDFIHGWNLIEQMKRRIDNWGSQEFQPYVLDISKPWTWSTPSDVATLMNAAWDSRAHVLWPHYWGSTGHAAFNASHVDGTSTLMDYALWTGTRMGSRTVSNGLVQWHVTGANPYLEAPYVTPTLDAAVDQFIVLEGDVNPVVSGGNTVDVRVDFHNSSGWKIGPRVTARAAQGHSGSFVFDMSSAPDWSGTIDAIRVRPALDNGDYFSLGSVTYAHHNVFSSAVKALIAAKKDLPRPALVTPFSIAPNALPYDLAVAVTGLDANAPSGPHNLVVFGTDPHFPNHENQVFDDFATAGNFEYVAASSTSPVHCGAVTLDAIRAPAPTFLGLRKTGRFRRMALPSASDLHLSFRLGIEDNATYRSPSIDGVRFRVVLRDNTGLNHELFARDWRPAGSSNHWSETQYVSLASYAGTIVDLLFETQGIGDTTGDAAAWGVPRIERLKFFRSQGLDDGWIQESDTNPGLGGTTGQSSNGNGLRAGDVIVSALTSNRAFRSIVSFDTSALAGTTLQGATLALFRGTLRGSPFGSAGAVGPLGALEVDLKSGFFGASSSLEPADFEAAASVSTAAVIPTPIDAGWWAVGDFTSGALASINQAGITQCRVQFTTPTANASASDWVGFQPGEMTLGASYAPLLVVSYR